MKDYNRPDWTTLITTLGNRISSGNRTEEVDMSMWDTLFPLANGESCGTHVARYLATYQGDKYELFTDIGGTPLCINKIIERITLNKKAKQIEWQAVGGSVRGWLGGRLIYNISGFSFDRFAVDVNLPPSPLYSDSVDTIHHSADQAKQACQDHLQVYVDGLYLQLQELTQT